VALIASPIAVKQPDPRPQLPNPLPLKLKRIKWAVRTHNNPLRNDEVNFCLNPKEYESLSYNQAETLRWIREAFYRLDYYSNRDPEKEN
jgi:hypothetical protein